MSTPAMLFGSIVRFMLVTLTAFWAASFITLRIAVFVDAWQHARRVQQDEAWLREQCADPEFYANMRQHTDLCMEVRQNAERLPLLQALSAVANTAHLCGRHSCADAVLYISQRGGLPVIMAALAALVMAPGGVWMLCKWALAPPLYKEQKYVI